MSLKHIINNKKLFAKACTYEMCMPEEPLIFSLKYTLGKRRLPVQHFRNKQWRSILKCYFRSWRHERVPLVILVKFFVSPPSYVEVSKKDLKAENIPAIQSYELSDYYLSLLDLLHDTLITSHRQIVKTDMEKFYSSKPRTIFKIMTWSEYVEFQNENSWKPSSKGFRAIRVQEDLQPEFDEDGADNAEGEGEASSPTDGTPS
jgi:hypothetical protein